MFSSLRFCSLMSWATFFMACKVQLPRPEIPAAKQRWQRAYGSRAEEGWEHPGAPCEPLPFEGSALGYFFTCQVHPPIFCINRHRAELYIPLTPSPSCQGQLMKAGTVTYFKPVLLPQCLQHCPAHYEFSTNGD